jgi:hypothetical protein
MKELQERRDRLALARATVMDEREAELIENPQLAEALQHEIDAIEQKLAEEDAKQPRPADGGLADLIGFGASAPADLSGVRQPSKVEEYDDEVSSERLLAVADLYYIYQMERLGVFSVILKLQHLFKAGTVRLSAGQGANALYRYDRKQVLRYTRKDRLQAYRRVFGYGNVPPVPGAQPNHQFHALFVNFMMQVAEFFRDKRVSEVIRPRADDPSFGSIAVVRRAGLDLRNNLDSASYGHINVLRVEVMQLLDEAFVILESDDIKRLFGATDAWDVIEEVMRQHLNQPQINASQRNRMGIAGSEVLQWLSHPYILKTSRAEFEGLLLDIGDRAEEWTTSAQALGMVQRPSPRQLPWDGGRMAVATNGRSNGNGRYNGRYVDG